MRKFNRKIMVTYIEPLKMCNDEMFKRIDNFIVPGIYDYYLISNYGRIYNAYMNLFLKPGISGSGYNFVYLSTCNGQVMMQVHRLVMLVFNPIPNPNEFQVNHKDGNKFNNAYYNLEWVTRSENILHAYATGLHHIGEDSVKATITEKDAIGYVSCYKPAIIQTNKSLIYLIQQNL